MSQPTRARTTGAATRKARKSAHVEAAMAADAAPAAVVSDLAPHRTAAPAGDPAPALAADTLARTLRAVAAELERDPALAQRVAAAITTTGTAAPVTPVPVARAETDAGDGHEPELRRINRNFRPKLVTGASPDLGAGIPDPFALYARRGEDGLRSALEELRLGTLRAMAREHGLDPKGTLSQQNDADKLRAAILKAAKKGRK